MNLVKNRAVTWFPLILYSAIIFYFSSVQLPLTEGVDISYMHIPTYFLMSVLFLRLFLTEGYEKLTFSKSILLAILCSFVFGALTEAWQSFLPGRFFSYYDMLLNLIGASFLYILKIFKREKLAKLLLLK